jgi:hypothetical protein
MKEEFMKPSKYRVYIKLAAVVSFFVLSAAASDALAQRKSVTVKFEAGINRDWDHAWMTTAPGDVIATITAGGTSLTRSPANYSGTITFKRVPCGGQARINIRFVGTAAYKSNSRDYTRKIPCSNPTVNLGRLEYGRW